MRTAAKFFGKISDFYDTHFLAVFFTEKRHRACFFRFFNRQHFRNDRNIFRNLLVDYPLHFRQLFRRHCREMRKVET